jgi:hypothetical protein
MRFRREVTFQMDEESGDLWLQLDGRVLGKVDVALNLTAAFGNESIIGRNLKSWADRESAKATPERELNSGDMLGGKSCPAGT